MALSQTKVVTLTGESKIAGEVVVRLSATVNSKTDVSSAYSEQVLNTTLYKENKAEIRQDMDAFRVLIYGLEDELAAEDII